MVDRLEDFHWYNGLHHEVVVEDCYGLKAINWTPDVIFDIGANVGVFSRFARELFPSAKIVAVEPNAENCELFQKFTPDDNLILLEKAIGDKPVWKHGGSVNGIYTYTSPGLGYDIEQMEAQRSEEDTSGHMIETSVPTILPAELLDTYTLPGQKVLMKIDCEGGENAIWTHQESLDKMKTIDYLTIEIHWLSNTGGKQHDNVQMITLGALIQFKETHHFTLTNILFTAKRKRI